MYLASRPETFAKLFFLLSFSGLLMYVVLAFYSFHTAFITITKSEGIKQKTILEPPKRFENDFQYILLWTIPELKYNLTADGQQVFFNNNCSFTNCFLTTDKDLLDKDVRNFNAIVFSVNTLKNWAVYMPAKRSPKQKYVFYSMIAAEKFPICNIRADGFFNWTWSYKLYSDIVTPFIEVKDMKGRVVAPRHGSNWTDSLENPDKSLEVATDKDDSNLPMVGNKTKALMWYTSKCGVDRKLMSFVRQLKQAMNEHALVFDIYGCGFKKCPEEGCFKALERDYYFYLAQEEVFSEDYVTTEVLKAYHHNAVPVVMGGADYLKYLPFNSYIDGTHELVEHLVALMNYAIITPVAYSSYFTWKKNFTINEVNLQRGYCDLCTMLNDRRKMETKTVYNTFRSWWYSRPLSERCFPKGAERYDDVLSYVKAVSKP